MTSARHRWALVAAPAAVPAVLAAALWVGGSPAMTHDRSFRVLTPEDGSTVGAGATVAWTAADGAASYALVVDVAPPRPGAPVRPGTHVMTLTDRSMALTLGRATTGSPSARAVHRLTVVPVDAAGRRLGEDVATVTVRTRS